MSQIVILVGLVVAIADKQNNPSVLLQAKKKHLSLCRKNVLYNPGTDNETKSAAKSVTPANTVVPNE